jgi:predicted dehydrogenase/threonine dehydrogenase-like Zn-dependent dehydrogenase
VDGLVALLKAFLNRIGSAVLARLGYSGPMIDDAKREVRMWVCTRSQALTRRVPLVSGRAVVWTRPGVAELLSVDVPLAREGEVTIEIATSVISPGTERAHYLQLPNTVKGYPFQPGYSASGVVLSAPSASAGLEPGDSVAVANVPHASVATIGVDEVFRVPAGVPLVGAALMQIGVICGQGLRRADIAADESVVVIGAGLIGVVTARLAVANGFGPVTVVARSHAKQEIADGHGVYRFIASDEAPGDVERIGARVVIEATGDPAVFGTAVAAAGQGARVVLLGSPRGVTRDFPAEAVRAKGLRLIGAHVVGSTPDARRREGVAFLEHLAGSRLHVDDLLDEVVDPREAEAFYRRLAGSRELVGARFDWTKLPAGERVARHSLLTPPTLSARGADMRRPVPASRGVVPRVVRRPHSDGRVRPLRIGLLGCGDIAVQNADAISAAPSTRLVACFDPVDELALEIASTYGAARCASSEALLERPDVDAVLLAVPHHLHLPLGEQAASAGKHVIVEKPLAQDLEAARALVDAAGRAGVHLSVCFPQRYEPAVVEARRLLDAGAIGRVTGMTLRFLVDKPPSYWSGGFSGRAQTDWRRARAKSGGGVLIMNLSHSVDLFRHLTGLDADEVVAHTQADDPTSEIEDCVAITARYVNGAIGSILGATSVRGAETTELRLWGSDGQLAVEPVPLVYTLRALDGVRAGRWQALARPKNGSNGRTLYFERLAAAIGSSEEPEVTGRDGLAVQAFIEAAYRSAAEGERMRPGSLLEAKA